MKSKLEAIEALKDFFRTRQQSYRLVFRKDSLAAKTVLKDLAKFCRAHSSTFNSDARLHAVAEGRREVWLRIQEHLNLTTEEFLKLHPIKGDSDV